MVNPLLKKLRAVHFSPDEWDTIGDAVAESMVELVKAISVHQAVSAERKMSPEELARRQGSKLGAE